jgi:hypothetical protein
MSTNANTYSKLQARRDARAAAELKNTADRKHAQNVVCPHCEAAVGWFCVNPHGDRVTGKSHAKRAALAGPR